MIRPLALALLALAPAADDLLPETPRGWRYERIELPLQFAPDIAFEGYEELRFAPGMFDARAEDYWSYALALRLETQDALDAAFVQDFLERYYWGLTSAVAQGSGLELSPEDFRVQVERVEEHYEARIDLVDAFVTGEPIELSLVLDTYVAPDHTQLFGIASPAPREAGVWSDLLGIRERWLAARPPAVSFNHAFFVVDEATYAALAGAEFLRGAFAVGEERTTVRSNDSYSGLYLYGTRTYFEFVGEQAAMGLVPGTSGLALGIEREGGTDAIQAAFGEAGVRAFRGPKTREFEGEQLPWFEAMGVEAAHAESRFQLFSMEYARDFLARWHAQLAPSAGGIGRAAVLERYRAQLGAQEREPLFQDVVGVELELDASELERFLASARVYGWQVERQEEQEVQLRAPNLRIQIRLSEEPGGLRGLVLSLREDVEREPLELGRLRLEFEGAYARLRWNR